MSPPGLDMHAREDLVVSIGSDGRVYFHDLDPELIAVALALNPHDELMRRRAALCPQPPTGIEGLDEAVFVTAARGDLHAGEGSP